MTSGYGDDPAEILARTFEESSDEMVVLRGISFHSTCEHHMLPFYGEASVGYLPGKVVGISKLARLVDCFARRLQIQERLTRQIAESVEEHLEARGVGVIIRAHHLCMGCRGVRQQTTEMVTSAMLGTLRNDAMARAEFLRLDGVTMDLKSGIAIDEIADGGMLAGEVDGENGGARSPRRRSLRGRRGVHALPRSARRRHRRRRHDPLPVASRLFRFANRRRDVRRR